VKREWCLCVECVEFGHEMCSSVALPPAGVLPLVDSLAPGPCHARVAVLVALMDWAGQHALGRSSGMRSVISWNWDTNSSSQNGLRGTAQRERERERESTLLWLWAQWIASPHRECLKRRLQWKQLVQ
jgi:hypothetical protein